VLRTPPTRHIDLSVESVSRIQSTDNADSLIPQIGVEPRGFEPIHAGHGRYASAMPFNHAPPPFDEGTMECIPTSMMSLVPYNALTEPSEISSSSFSALDCIELDPYTSSLDWPTLQTSAGTVTASLTILPLLGNRFMYILPAIKILLQNSGVATHSFLRTLEQTCLPDTWQLLRTQSLGIQFIYNVVLSLVNNHDLSKLRNPESQLDMLYKGAIEHVFSLSSAELNQFLDSFQKPLNRAIEQGLVRAAVELNAPGPLSVIIQRGLDLNGISCIIDGIRYSILERACLLSSAVMVQTLLRLGADPNKHSNIKHSSTYGIWDFIYRTGALVHETVNIFESLINAGASPRPEHISRILTHCKLPLLQHIVVNLLHMSKDIFIENWGLASILGRPDVEQITPLIQSILDQDYPPDIRNSDLWASVLTESLCHAAYRQNMEAVGVLLKFNARPISNCLIFAVKTENMQAIKLFVGLGVDANSPYRPSCQPGKFYQTHDAWNAPQIENSLNSCTALSRVILKEYNEAFQLFKELGFVDKLANNRPGLISAMSAAATVGDEALVDIFLTYGPFLSTDYQSYETENHEWSSVVSSAVRSGHDTIVRKLLQAGIHPRSEEISNAVISRQTVVVELLIDLMDLSACYAEVMFKAVQWGEKKIIKTLLATGESMEGEFVLRIDGQEWYTGILGAAILRKDRTVVNLLIEHGAPINPTTTGESDRKLTALAGSVYIRDVELCHELLRQGADPCDEWALFFAVEVITHEFVEILLDAFTKRYPFGRKKYGPGALQKLLEAGDFSTFRRLAVFVDVNSLTLYEGWLEQMLSITGLALRSWTSKSVQFLNLLLEDWKTPDVIVCKEYYTKGPDRKTALLYAIELANGVQLVEKLVRAGASVNYPAKSRVLRTPLQYAAELGKEDIVLFLLHEGADPNGAPASHAGATALQLAAIKGHLRIANILIQHNADVNAPPALLDGRTTFEGAAEHGRIEMILFLVQHGLNLLNETQYTRAVRFAERNGQLAAKELAKQLYDAATQKAMDEMLRLENDAPWDDFTVGGMGDFPLFDASWQ
jgi:ankyrin repeat protein